MKKIVENFSKLENLLFNIMIGAYIANVLTLAIIVISDGKISIWLMSLVLPAAIFFFFGFFIFIYLLVIYTKNDLGKEIKIGKTVAGILLSPLGLLFSFFNYIIIVLANIY